MKPFQAPIYRAIERLMLWAVPVVAHLPKATSYEALGTLLMHDLHESLKITADAVTANSDMDKIAGIRALSVRVASIKTAMRVLLQARHNGVPVVSRKQEARFLELISPIDKQSIAWLNKLSANPGT